VVILAKVMAVTSVIRPSSKHRARHGPGPIYFSAAIGGIAILRVLLGTSSH
jgi:hypothetical protein